MLNPLLDKNEGTYIIKIRMHSGCETEDIISSMLIFASCV